MTKTILITGASDGIGLAAAKSLAAQNHSLILHGRNSAKLDAAAKEIGGNHRLIVADLSDLKATEAMADDLLQEGAPIDVLLNNAGVFKTSQPMTADGRDVRFIVNTIAPYLLTRKLLPLIPKEGRIVNLSSAAQAPVDLDALTGTRMLGDDFTAYAQSKLAITMWTQAMAEEMPNGPLVVSVNPGSLLATKMVKEGFGMAGNDISIGSDILIRAALSQDFEGRSGAYFDNDAAQFAPPHPDAARHGAAQQVVSTIEQDLRQAQLLN